MLQSPVELAQYACAEYVDTLAQHGMIASMSRPGNPYDNAKCERFIRTLEQGEIRCREYRDIEDLRANLQVFFERYYNADRLHSALGYRSPDAFEREAAKGRPRTSVRAHAEFYKA